MVRLKGLDVYYPNLDIPCRVEYSTCGYYMICVRNALFNIFELKIAVFGYFSHSMSHMSGLKRFQWYKESSGILLVPVKHISIFNC